MIGPKSAVIGSANLTDSGIRKRTELGVLIEDTIQVAELTQWFDDCWATGVEIPVDDLRAYAESLPQESQQSEESEMFPPSPAVLACLTPLKPAKSGRRVEPGDRARLLDRLRIIPDRKWWEDFFQLARMLLDATGLTGEDSSLVTSIPLENRGWLLPISINNRYVLGPKVAKGQRAVGVICTDPASLGLDPSAIVREDRFDRLPGEENDCQPYFVKLKSPAIVLDNDNLLENWREAARAELPRSQSSPYRRFHSEAFYRAIVDIKFLQAALDEAGVNG